jgi:hypothetical protein
MANRKIQRSTVTQRGTARHTCEPEQGALEDVLAFLLARRHRVRPEGEETDEARSTPPCQLRRP